MSLGYDWILICIQTTLMGQCSMSPPCTGKEHFSWYRRFVNISGLAQNGHHFADGSSEYISLNQYVLHCDSNITDDCLWWQSATRNRLATCLVTRHHRDQWRPNMPIYWHRYDRDMTQIWHRYSLAGRNVLTRVLEFLSRHQIHNKTK